MASKKRTTKKKKQSKRKELGKGTVVTFMKSLIEAGYLGDSIPESLGEKDEAAKEIRIMGERLSRQVLRHGEGDATTTETEE